jgi:hypothetical protein
MNAPVNPVDLTRSSSGGTATITPNTPSGSNKILSPVITVDSSTQTDINGIEVGRIFKSVDIIQDLITVRHQNMISQAVNETVKNITD